jgi:hypothetical protein
VGYSGKIGFFVLRECEEGRNSDRRAIYKSGGNIISQHKKSLQLIAGYYIDNYHYSPIVARRYFYYQLKILIMPALFNAIM